jgi:hypothetical protein
MFGEVALPAVRANAALRWVSRSLRQATNSGEPTGPP